jgi:hypothetical protein
VSDEKFSGFFSAQSKRWMHTRKDEELSFLDIDALPSYFVRKATSRNFDSELVSDDIQCRPPECQNDLRLDLL